MIETSLVTACKNREANLLKVLDSWLCTDCEELIFVDWSCDVPLFETFHQAGIKDKRIRIYRVENESRWILTHAYNVGLKRSEGNRILKLDNDHVITRNFFAVNSLEKGIDARLGSWRLAKDSSQAYINGAFIARSKSIRDVGYFNELITTYGWDDTYLHESLFSNGASIAYLDPGTIRHIDQDEKSRTAQQAVSLEEQLAVSVDKNVTEFMNRRNMYLTAVLPRQSSNAEHSHYEILREQHENGLHVAFMHRLSNPTHQLDNTYLKLANLLAYRDLYAWKHGLKPLSITLSDVHELHEALEPIGGAAAQGPRSQRGRAHASESRKKEGAKQSKEAVSSLPVGLSKQLIDVLWKLLPAACSYYGHTTNEFRYQIDISRLALDEKAEQVLNGLLPNWAAEKVSFRLNPEPPDSGTKVVIPWETADFLIESTLFKSRKNTYFWACMNSLQPCLKRSLYQLVEKGGRPNDVILNITVQSFMRGAIDQPEMIRRLTPLRMIFPSRSEEAFCAWINKRVKAISGYAGDEVASLVQSTLMNNLCVSEASLTLATALFKGSRHMIAYALNMRKMHLFERTDVVITIAPSPESRSQENYLREHFSNNANVTIAHLDNDPGLYECWNSTIRNAKSKYVGNANIDDRRGRYHSDYLIYLMEYAELDGATSALVADGADTHSTYSASQDIWYLGMERDIRQDDLLIEDDNSAKSQNMMHCMPIWNAKMHDDVGFFEECKYGTSADWEFWLRALKAEKRLSLYDIPLGFYLVDAKSHNRRSYDERRKREKLIIKKHFPSLDHNKLIELA